MVEIRSFLALSHHVQKFGTGCSFLKFSYSFLPLTLTIVFSIQMCSIFQCFGCFLHKCFPGLYRAYSTALGSVIEVVCRQITSVLPVCSGVQQFKNMHSTMGAFEVRLFLFLPEPMLMLVVLLAFCQYKMGQVSKSVRKVWLNSNVHNFLQEIFIKCFFLNTIFASRLFSFFVFFFGSLLRWWKWGCF